MADESEAGTAGKTERLISDLAALLPEKDGAPRFRPDTVMVSLSAGCGSDCGHCYQGERKGLRMTDERFSLLKGFVPRMTSEMTERPDGWRGRVIIEGGEVLPFELDRVCELLGECGETSLKSVYSNGLFLLGNRRDEIVGRLAEAGLDDLSISYYSISPLKAIGAALPEVKAPFPIRTSGDDGYAMAIGNGKGKREKSYMNEMRCPHPFDSLIVSPSGGVYFCCFQSPLTRVGCLEEAPAYGELVARAEENPLFQASGKAEPLRNWDSLAAGISEILGEKEFERAVSSYVSEGGTEGCAFCVYEMPKLRKLTELCDERWVYSP